MASWLLRNHVSSLSSKPSFIFHLPSTYSLVRSNRLGGSECYRTISNWHPSEIMGAVAVMLFLWGSSSAWASRPAEAFSWRLSGRTRWSSDRAACRASRRTSTQRQSVESRELRSLQSCPLETAMSRRSHLPPRRRSFFSSPELGSLSLSRSSLRVAAVADALGMYAPSARTHAAFVSTTHAAPLDRAGVYLATPHGRAGTGPLIQLTEQEADLFRLLSHAVDQLALGCTLRVAGGWVRDKLLATEDFHRTHIHTRTHPDSLQRLTSKYKGPSAGRKGTKLIGVAKETSDDQNVSFLSLANNSTQQPVDIDITLDNMLGREFAHKFNSWLSLHGRETHSVGVVLQNPEKSKHLETATMQVGPFWIDFVNLRAEEYTSDSRIPDVMRIGTPQEDAFRRDLTINALFYNIQTGLVEDWTGRGLDDLKKGLISTPLPPLTTLLDDPLRILRSIRFAARLRFAMDPSLQDAALNEKVRLALELKVSRERIGSEVDLMLRSQDPVGAMRLMVNLKFMDIVFPIQAFRSKADTYTDPRIFPQRLFERGLHLLTTTHDHLCSCKVKTPMWCEKKRAIAAATHGVTEIPLIDDEESRRKLWYAAFLKPIMTQAKALGQQKEASLGRQRGKKANRSPIMMLMIDELKRPVRDGEAVEIIIKAADDFTELVQGWSSLSASTVILGKISVTYGGDDHDSHIACFMGTKKVNPETERDPLWIHAMEFRLATSQVMIRVGQLWRAAFILSLCEQLADADYNHRFSYTIEGDVYRETSEEIHQGIISSYDAFAASLLQLGLVGIWSEKPLITGDELKRSILPNLPQGPAFREVMDEQVVWMTTHPGASRRALIQHLRGVFERFL